MCSVKGNLIVHAWNKWSVNVCSFVWLE